MKPKMVEKEDRSRRTRSPDVINQVTFCEEMVQISRFKLQ